MQTLMRHHCTPFTMLLSISQQISVGKDVEQWKSLCTSKLVLTLWKTQKFKFRYHRIFTQKLTCCCVGNFKDTILSFTFIIQILIRRLTAEVNTNQILKTAQWGTQDGAGVGLQLWECKIEFILILWLFNNCIISHKDNCKPTCAPPCIIIAHRGPSVSNNWKFLL